MYCDGNDQAKNLKAKLAKVIKTTPDNIQMLHQDKIVDDEKTLADQRIENDNVIIFRHKKEGTPLYKRAKPLWPDPSPPPLWKAPMNGNLLTSKKNITYIH